VARAGLSSRIAPRHPPSSRSHDPRCSRMPTVAYQPGLLVSKHVKHVPKHRGAPSRPALVEQPRKAIRSTVVMSSVAVAATGIVVSGGVAGAGPASVTAAAETASGTASPRSSEGGATVDRAELVPDATLAEVAAAAAGERATISRSADRRAEADPVKEAALAEPDQGEVAAVTDSVDLAQADPRTIGAQLLGEFGYGQDQFGCLDSLWTKESGWNISADNPTSSAYGIPQALPGEKMASAGADWATNPVTQIRWGLGYIGDVYGSPCGAWAHSQAYNWY